MIESDRTHMTVVEHINFYPLRSLAQWVDLRENLPETIDFPMKPRDFPVIFPLNQSIDWHCTASRGRGMTDRQMVITLPGSPGSGVGEFFSDPKT